MYSMNPLGQFTSCRPPDKGSLKTPKVKLLTKILGLLSQFIPSCQHYDFNVFDMYNCYKNQ